MTADERKLTELKLRDFLNHKVKRNEWMYFVYGDNSLDVYLRKQDLYCGPLEGYMGVFTIASIEVSKPGQRLFSHFLPIAETVAPTFQRSLYVENVHNERLAAFLQKRGYRELKERSAYPWSYLLKLQPSGQVQ